MQTLPPAYPGMRIGLFGGSFNPAHTGHRHICQVALQRLQLDQIWWLVTPGNPLKDSQELADIGNRSAAAERIASHPRMIVTAFEQYLPSPYAIGTIHFLQRRFPGVRFIWIMGGDNLADFHHWRYWEEIFRSLPIVVVDRPGTRHIAMASHAAQRFSNWRLPENNAGYLPFAAPPAWVYLTAPLRDISSTEIRRKMLI